ncbi:hypothetical protein BGZ58_003461, partial [Dissophora ornata]
MFPTLISVLETNVLDGLHSFFYDEDPRQWTPNRFASHVQAIDFMDYIKGLHKIKNSGAPSLGSYCNDIIRYLQDDPDGMNEERQAKRSIQLRKAMHDEKEDELILKSKTSSNYMKRRSEEESNGGSSQRPKPRARTPRKSTPIVDPSAKGKAGNSWPPMIQSRKTLPNPFQDNNNDNDNNDNDSNDNDGNEHISDSLSNRRPIIPVSSPSEMPSESATLPPTSPFSSSTPLPKHNRGRSSSLSSGNVPDGSLFVDPDSFSIHKYVHDAHNIGQLFHHFQVFACKTVNNAAVQASVRNISYFMAMNYILTTTDDLPGFPTEAMENIRKRFVWKTFRLGNSTAELCGRLDEQLALGDVIHDETGNPELQRIVVLYQMVALKLPLGFEQFDNGLEDTYCHGVIDALFAYRFPPRSRAFTIDWANGEAHGSKKRRGFGFKPDAIVLRHGKQIGFLEVKPPGNSHTMKEYLHDHWNLANFCKDAIDDFLHQGLSITKVAAVQLF